MQPYNSLSHKCMNHLLNPFVSIGDSVKIESKSASIRAKLYHACAARLKAMMATITNIAVVPFLLVASGTGAILGSAAWAAATGCNQRLKARATEISQWTYKTAIRAVALGILCPLSIFVPEFTINTLHAHEWEQVETTLSPNIPTDLLCVLYDAGETAALLPVLKKWEDEGRDFRVLVMATAETRVKPDMFPNKRLVLENLGATETVEPQTPRTKGLKLETIQKIAALRPKVVLAGMASRAQEQILEKFSGAKTVAFADNFNYDPAHESFNTVSKVHSVAKHILCPSQNVVETLVKTDKGSSTFAHKYYVVGKPTVTEWEKDISKVDHAKVLEKAGLEPFGKPIITFIGGYGEGYDVVDPLFAQSMEKLRQEGFRVIYQPHPRMAKAKIETTEALAVSDYIVGYNSSVILDAALIGKNALYMIPQRAPFDHFAINQGLISKVSDCEGLLEYLRSGKKCADVRATLNIPQNSTETISNLIESLAI